MARASNFSFTDDLRVALEATFEGLGQTNIGENAFNVQRQQESAARNPKMSNERRWGSLILSDLLKARFHYQMNPGWESQDVPSGFANRSMQGLYTSLVKESSPFLVNLVGTSKPVEWYSPDPARQAAVDSEFDLFTTLDKHCDWGRSWGHGSCRLSPRSLS